MIGPTTTSGNTPMGHWGFKSYENDDADEALDRALESVHRDEYDKLMDDRNPTPYEEAQGKLLDEATLKAAIEHLVEQAGDDLERWDELDRLAMAGVVVRHAEKRVACPEPWLGRAIEWLEAEEIDWDEPTKRQARRQREIELLKKAVRG